MPDVTPGREDDFRRLASWLAVSERIDGIIEASEERVAPASRRDRLQPVIPTLTLSLPVRQAGLSKGSRGVPPRGLRAGVAARLARFALAVHPRAAAEAVLRPVGQRMPGGTTD